MAAGEIIGSARIGALRHHPGDRIELNRKVFRVLGALLAAGVACGLSGCWLAALQYAPQALGLAENLGSGVASVATATAENVAMVTHGDSEAARQQEAARQAALTADDSCQQLELGAPGVVELRKSSAGTPEYRELALVGSLELEWTPVVVDDTAAADGWRPAADFLKLNFAPPLAYAIPTGSSDYLSYAPVAPITELEQDRMLAMTTNFGRTSGTFNWNGRQFNYVVTSTLPCFPPPPVLSAKNNLPAVE